LPPKRDRRAFGGAALDRAKRSGAVVQVLVVDDDRSFVASLVDAFADEAYELLTAGNGVEALEILDRHSVDLILTDINMPRMDGVQLVREVINRGGFVPCVVMTAYGTPDLEARVAQFGGIEFVHKPIDLPSLKQRIREALSARQESSLLRGIGLASFLQLLSTERKTCTVLVKAEGSNGLLFLRDGVLLDATIGDQSGQEAAYQLLSTEKAEIALRSGCRRKNRVIQEDLNTLLLEAFRRQDEEEWRTSAGGLGQDERLKEEAVMALESHLQDFREIKGYVASGIMDFTGEILASHSANPKVDLAAVGAVFNDIFRSAHEASSKIGMVACRNMVLNTPRGIIVMECSGVDAARHIHMITVLEEGGNQALVKVTIGKVLPKIVADLT
jgi:CheY-like chemotaxis protein/predicted regulator of Ras-like GTPase activity (Roadblock/LC7/MglB family)